MTWLTFGGSCTGTESSDKSTESPYPAGVYPYVFQMPAGDGRFRQIQ